jgi:hypothetical protein
MTDDTRDLLAGDGRHVREDSMDSTQPPRGPSDRPPVVCTAGYVGPVGLAVLFGVALVTGAPSRAGAKITFGTRCQGSFEGTWQQTLAHAYQRCSRFEKELKKHHTQRFSNSLVEYPVLGLLPVFDDFPGIDGADTVDLLYVSTHGGYTDTQAVLAAWKSGSFLRSRSWRFGDPLLPANPGLRVLSMYACDELNIYPSLSFLDLATMTPTDFVEWSNSWKKVRKRWQPAFAGGLIVATGAYDLLYDLEETGEDYAANLNEGKSVRWSWFDGNEDWSYDQHSAVLATGSSKSDCANRRDGVTLENLKSWPRRRDGDIHSWCWAEFIP